MEINRRMFSRCCAVFFFSAFATFSTVAQHVGTPRNSDQLFSLTDRKQIRKGVDLWPLIVGPSTPPIQRANSLLIAMNATLDRELKDCDRDLASYANANNITLAELNPARDWTRKVAVTMRGPRFISMVTEQTHVCNGSYPQNSFYAIVLDMRTGKPIEEDVLLTDAEHDLGAVNPRVDGIVFHELRMASLSAVVVDRAKGGCKKDLNQAALSFWAWPDSATRLLMVRPSGIPHVIESCEVPIGLTVDEARRLGFGSELLDALRRARR
jgi:hypothetical protein